MLQGVNGVFTVMKTTWHLCRTVGLKPRQTSLINHSSLPVSPAPFSGQDYQGGVPALKETSVPIAPQGLAPRACCSQRRGSQH